MHKIIDTLTHPASTFTTTLGINAVTPANDIWDIVVKVGTTIIALIPFIKEYLSKRKNK